MATATTADLATTTTVETDVRCPRCNGLMVPDRFIDLLDDTGHLEFIAARCVSCGEVVDPVILENRDRALHRRDRENVAAEPLVAA